MELRACEDISMAQDITLRIHPLAFALSHSMHHSRCSACFSPLTNNTNNNGHLHLSCNSCKSSVSYCSQACSDADLHCHQSSGECCLFGILHHNPNSHWHISNSSDLRVALRLLRSFELLGFLSDKSSDMGSSRIGGLMSNREKLLFEQFDDDQSGRIREGARIMGLARKMGSGGIETGEENLVMEETVLCLVITNGVEVLVDEGSLVQVHCLSLGTAVYGPLFSWCNHSCRPNACYRFCLTPPSDFATGLGGYCRIMPQGKESMPSSTIGRDGSKLSSGNCNYGPRIILRSIRPILKGEEVCIAYTDLLQPKVKRHSELWLKYRFVCCCDRCIGSPSTYADRVLQLCSKSFSFSLHSKLLKSNGRKPEICSHEETYDSLVTMAEMPKIITTLQIAHGMDSRTLPCGGNATHSKNANNPCGNEAEIVCGFETNRDCGTKAYGSKNLESSWRLYIEAKYGSTHNN